MSDLISRCELFNRLATIQADTPNEMKGKIYEVIQEAPTIDRPKGEWIERQNRDGSLYHQCSECNYYDDERDDLSGYNFCPDCGADMRGDCR